MRLFHNCERSVDYSDKTSPIECEYCPNYKECKQKFLDEILRKSHWDILNEDHLYEFSRELSDEEKDILTILNDRSIRHRIPSQFMFDRVTTSDVVKTYSPVNHRPFDEFIEDMTRMNWLMHQSKTKEEIKILYATAQDMLLNDNLE